MDKNDLLIVGGVALAVMAIGMYVKTKVGEGIDSTKEAVVQLWDESASAVSEAATAANNALNPTKDSNVFNQTAQTVYKEATGSKGTIGSDLYDLNHPINVPGTPNHKWYMADTDEYGRVTNSFLKIFQ